jgi:hypothetical protein
LVIKSAQSDNEHALKLARKIDDPWYRTQALAWVARYAPIGKVEGLAKEALETAAEQADPYKVVAASAWPVRALIERERGEVAEEAIVRLLDLSERIDHPVSRLEALFLLWEAVYLLGDGMRRQVQDKLVAACRAADSWKAGDRLAWAATILAADHPEEAQELVAALREGRVKRQALRRMGAGKTEKVREFFS